MATREHGVTRTTSSAITFSHPFRLGSDARQLPPGVYTVHTDEHLFSRGDHNWSLRAEVVVEVRQGGSTSFRHVAAADLDRAIAHDAARSVLLHESSENPDRESAVTTPSVPASEYAA